MHPSQRVRGYRRFTSRRVLQTSRWTRYLLADDHLFPPVTVSPRRAVRAPATRPPPLSAPATPTATLGKLSPLTHRPLPPSPPSPLPLPPLPSTRQLGTPPAANPCGRPAPVAAPYCPPPPAGSFPARGRPLPPIAVSGQEEVGTLAEENGKHQGLPGPVGPAFAFAVWRRRKAVQNVSEAEDLTLGCIKVLGQFNKKLARLHYLLMFLGLPEKGTQKLHEELVANRRGCMEMCWHIRDNLFAKMTRAALQGEATAYVRTLTDCLEMYVKELAILSHLHADTLLNTLQNTPSSSKKKGKGRRQKVHPSSNNAKPDEAPRTILDSERQEVMELLQMILNKLTARTDEDADQITSVEATSTTTTSAVVSIRKAVRPSRFFLCCDCFCTDEYR